MLSLINDPPLINAPPTIIKYILLCFNMAWCLWKGVVEGVAGVHVCGCVCACVWGVSVCVCDIQAVRVQTRDSQQHFDVAPQVSNKMHFGAPNTPFSLFVSL